MFPVRRRVEENAFSAGWAVAEMFFSSLNFNLRQKARGGKRVFWRKGSGGKRFFARKLKSPREGELRKTCFPAEDE